MTAPDKDSGEPKVVATAGSHPEALLIAGLLQNNGIEAFVRADDAGNQFPSVDVNGIEVLVSAEDAERAGAILRGAEPLRDDETVATDEPPGDEAR